MNQAINIRNIFSYFFWRLLFDKYMYVCWHSGVICTSISVVKRLLFFSQLCGGKHSNFSYSRWPIHCILYQNLLSTGRYFHPYITRQALFQFIFWQTKCPETKAGIITGLLKIFLNKATVTSDCSFINFGPIFCIIIM